MPSVVTANEPLKVLLDEILQAISLFHHDVEEHQHH